MYRSLLVPLDGSPFGEQALPLALSIARHAKASVQLVHVHVPLATLYAGPRGGLENAREPLVRSQEQSYLEQIVKRLTAVASVPVTAALLDGTVPDVLHEHAATVEGGLIVMTTHGRGPLSRFWLGSVADNLIRRSALPVLLVHPQNEPPDLAEPPVLRHVLIPLDGSPLAEQILEPVVALGRLMNADYLLLRALEPLQLVGHDALGYGVVPDLGEPGPRVEEAQIYLDRVAERLREQGLTVRSRVLAGSLAASAILDEADGQAMNLIALATHGRHGLARLLLGSVADKVIRGASIPVLTFRPRSK
jgi:nucleotide-binding universal stress UspA family protein